MLIKKIFNWVSEITIGSFEAMYKFAKILMVMIIVGTWLIALGKDYIGILAILMIITVGGMITEFDIKHIVRIARLKK